MRYAAIRRGALVAGTVVVGLLISPIAPRAAGPNVLLVGPAGTAGAQYTSIQDAVNHAQAGDWVLVAPGVYHEKGSNDNSSNGAKAAGVLITQPGLHLRGMDRAGVIVDGTNLPGSADGSGTQPASALGSACPTAEAAQDLGPTDSSNNHLGRNGVEAYKASGVWIENMTVCNFMQVNGDHAGNEVWWDAGDSSGAQIPMTVWGSHLTATTTYFKDSVAASPFAQYGIFTSNIAPDPAYGPSLIDQTYANNMADSAYYIGACPDCNIVLRHAHAQNSALGYSGTNGSGRVLIELGEWDHSRSGIVPNTLNNDDAPPPQQGTCPAGQVSPEPAAPSTACFVVRNNFVHDNNNPDTPGSGIAGFGPVGVGIELSGTKGDAIVHNTVVTNGSWGIAAHDFPDTGTFPSDINSSEDCNGGTGGSGGCFFPSGLNSIIGNTLSGNGTNGNATNGDLLNEQLAADVAVPGPNCYQQNVNSTGGAPTEFPPLLQESNCTGVDSTMSGVAAAGLICAAGIVSATTGLPVSCDGIPQFSYPVHDVTADNCQLYAPGSAPMGDACIMPLSATLAVAALQPKMDACTAVPAPPPNAFCPAAAAVSSPSPSILPLTGTAGPLPPVALPWIVIAALALVAVPLLRGRVRQ